MLDITFGELEEATPRRARRPDANALFATSACGAMRAQDLPVFVDLDIMRELESHAHSNTHVELGGVLLGGQFHDEAGRPFVLITEAVRAEHYEATRGSFKFTHETWSAISRRREEFPPELAMVGWYHTHPDWSVFLSGMDVFICQHFFNKPLDVALVIDPCQKDRGFFEWSGPERETLRRTGGFYLMTSRLREAELKFFVAQLEGQLMSPNTSPQPNSPYPYAAAPVVPWGEPRPAWQLTAVWATLGVQFLVLALLTFRMLGPAPQAVAIPSETSELQALVALLHKQNDEQQARTQLQAQAAVLDRVLARLNEGTEGLAAEVEKREAENEKLRAAVAGYATLERSLAQAKQDLGRQTLTGERLSAELKEARSLHDQAKALAHNQATQLTSLKRELAELKGEAANGELPPGHFLSGWGLLQWGLALSAAVAVAATLAYFMAQRRLSAVAPEGEKEKGPAGHSPQRATVRMSEVE